MSKKIAIVVKSLSGGGAERSAAMLSIILNYLNHDVHLVLLYPEIDFNYSGKLHILKSENTTNNKIKLFKKFKKIFKDQEFDLVVDFRGKTKTIRELIINKSIYKHINQKVFTIHSSLLNEYLPEPFFLFKKFYNSLDRIVTVSKGQNRMIETTYRLNNIMTIPNAIDIDFIRSKMNESIDLNFNYMVFAGRLENNVKQVDTLIKAYSNSKLIEKEIKLLIIGDGKDKNTLKHQVSLLNLQDHIIFIPFQKNIYKYLYNSKCLVLTSKREAFGYVLVEALACDTPVISFNCPTGPSDIISHENNGLLVKDQDIHSLIEAMNRFAEDEALLNLCKANALDSVTKYNYKNIAKEWEKIIA